MTSLPFSTTTYQQRRNSLMQNMGSGKILLFGNKESSVNFRDNWYPFRQDSTFLYYGGISLPDLYMLIDVDNETTTLFGNDLTLDDIVWTGPQPSLNDLAEQAGITHVERLNNLPDYLKEEIHYLPPYRPEHELLLHRYPLKDPSISLIKAIAEQRSVKSDEELDHMYEAANLTALMHETVIEYAKEGMKEHQLVSIASQVAWDHGVQWSFNPIMTINGNILHNHYYGNTLSAGDMVLFDGGIEVPSGYAGDMTRTFPVSSCFTPLQKDMYQIVLNAYEAAVEMLAPGVKFLDIHLRAAKALVSGLKGLGIMTGDPDEAVAAGAHTMFFQCGLGHLIGLDVHDMENLGEPYIGYTEDLVKSTEFGLKSLRLGKALEERYTVTVEPGIYIIPELIDRRRSEKKYEAFIDYTHLHKIRDFGGIRIEDDFVVTAEGSEILGEPLARTAEEMEELRQL